MDKDEPSGDLIDVRNLIEELGIEGVCRTAEDYFGKLEPSILAKPFNDINETPELLTCVAQLLQGLNLLPEMTVLDFGAGSCWLSRFLSQLGLSVIALDVSRSALKMGQELYHRQPLVGDQPDPRFLHFDGRHINLEDGSVDRIVSFDAFHHTPNPVEVIKEFGRVLKPGGIAGFSEPGPEHSHLPQSQAEMRMYRIVENDIHMEEIWDAAQLAGFTNIKLSVFNPQIFLLPLNEFQTYVAGEGAAGAQYLENTRAYMQQHRVFMLYKGESSMPGDSRQQSGLLAELDIQLASTHVIEGELIHFKVVVKNAGDAVWLPTTGLNDSTHQAAPLLDGQGKLLKENLRRGAVHLGAHLFDRQGRLLERDYSRHLLTPDARQVKPGETRSFQATLVSPPKGQYVLEFDLVSEWVCWFEGNGSKTVKVELEVS